MRLPVPPHLHECLATDNAYYNTFIYNLSIQFFIFFNFLFLYLPAQPTAANSGHTGLRRIFCRSPSAVHSTAHIGCRYGALRCGLQLAGRRLLFQQRHSRVLGKVRRSFPHGCAALCCGWLHVCRTAMLCAAIRLLWQQPNGRHNHKKQKSLQPLYLFAADRMVPLFLR